jgi:hypothetical protein
MHAKGIAAGALGGFEADSGRISRAIELSTEHAEIYQAMLKTAPTNAAAWNNLGVAYAASAGYLSDMGRFAESRDMMLAAASVGDKMPTSARPRSTWCTGSPTWRRSKLRWATKPRPARR